MSVQNLSGWWLGRSTEEYSAAKDTKTRQKNKTRTVVVSDFELNLLGTLRLTPEETLKSEEEKNKKWTEKHKCF